MLTPPRSLWWDTLDEPVVARPALAHDLDVDVAIVGGGYSGLWTARELLRRDPHLHVVVLEQSVCGYGASGRNGGWASALFPVGDKEVIRRFGQSKFADQRALLRREVSALGAAISDDAIESQFVHGGSLVFARSEVQSRRLQLDVERSIELGSHEGDFRWLTREQALDRANLSSVYGATFTPHCGRLHPAKLVRGLANVVETLGVTIFEATSVARILPATRTHRATAITAHGNVRANVVIRATEGFTPTLPKQRRQVAPLFSLMIATEPLANSFWEQTGLRHFETFADDRHLIIYGQRTADNRIAFGGRGAPYHFGSTVEPRFAENARVFGLLASTLHELFPSLDVSVTHQWGGPLAMPRDLTPSVVFDSELGLASLGGYTGDGVVLSRTCAQALADLIVTPNVTSEFTNLGFVQRLSRKWEIEPLRWLGVNTGLRLATWADRREQRTSSETFSAGLLRRLTSSSDL